MTELCKILTLLPQKQNGRQNIAGLTLAEVLVVIFVMGALMITAIPRYSNVVNRQRAREGEQMLLALLSSQKRYQLDYGVYAPNLGSLDITVTDYTTDSFKLPTATSNPNSLAQIQRSDDSYTLSINQNAQITCTPAGSACTNSGY